MMNLKKFTTRTRYRLAFLENHHVFSCGAFLLVSLFLWFNFENSVLSWFDERILPLLDIKTKWLLDLIVSLGLIAVIIDTIKKYKKAYVLYYWHLAIILLFDILLTWYRYSGRYEYQTYVWVITYIDVALAIGLSYIILTVINTIRNSQIPSQTDSPFDDKPICSHEMDCMEFDSEAKRLAEYIDELPRNRAWSIGITAPWGCGKTSFINLAKNYFIEDKFLVVPFNPRNSKSVSSIQEEFFSALSSSVSKYNSATSEEVKRYMASLKLIDGRSIFQKALSYYKLWDRDSAKHKVNTALASLPVRVIVVIDDFDRLLSEEIVEVLKLLDSNAAFNNIVFLTAYDKDHVKSVLGESYQSGNTDFADKFFNYEYRLPVRPYNYVFKYFKKLVLSEFTFENSDYNSIQQQLDDCFTLLSKYMPTLRDAKRFGQLLSRDYVQVEGEVYFKDFLLIELVKYRYPDEHIRIYQKEVLDPASILTSSEYVYPVPEEVAKLCCADIVDALFPKKDSVGDYRFRRINERKSFYMYFVGQVLQNIKLKDLRSILVMELEESKKYIAEWRKNGFYKDLTDFIEEKSSDFIYDWEQLHRFIRLLTYLSSVEMDINIRSRMMELVKDETFKDYQRAFKCALDDYKGCFFDALLQCPDAIQFYIDLSARYDEIPSGYNEFIFTRVEVENLIREEFDRYAATHASCDEGMMTRLYGCVSSIDPQTRLVTLDASRCKVVRDKIKAGPNYYMNSFLRLGMISSSPTSNSAACEPFWRQLFGSPEEFKTFITSDECDGCDRIKAVRSFWEMYEANEYKPIEFSGLGNSQELLDWGFTPLYSLYKDLRGIEGSLVCIKNKWDSKKTWNRKNSYQIKKEVDELLASLDKVNLYIRFHGKLRECAADLSNSVANYMAHISDVKKGDVVPLDFIRLKADHFNSLQPQIYFNENVFKIESVTNNRVKLDGLEQIIPLDQLEYIPVDGQSDACIYYEPVVMASIIASDQSAPLHYTDYSYYMDSLKRSFDEKGVALSDKVSKYDYVHEIQHYLRRAYKHEDLKINHSYKG